MRPARAGLTDDANNIDLWEMQGGLNAADRRVLLTVWVADAIEIVQAKRGFVKGTFTRTRLGATSKYLMIHIVVTWVLSTMSCYAVENMSHCVLFTEIVD